ncbi:MAG: hypothetical protein U1D35_11385, partial [Paracoccaceae bacterium]|nr:hypothetical protein [Paracoccaceae bacterium]
GADVFLSPLDYDAVATIDQVPGIENRTDGATTPAPDAVIATPVNSRGTTEETDTEITTEFTSEIESSPAETVSAESAVSDQQSDDDEVEEIESPWLPTLLRGLAPDALAHRQQALRPLHARLLLLHDRLIGVGGAGRH